MKTFVKDAEKMTERELRLELLTTRQIIDDIYKLTENGSRFARTEPGKQSVINQIAHYCRREMPR